MENKIVKSNRGGKREGAGRKPKPDGEKKEPLYYWVKGKHLKKAKRKIDPIVEEFNKM